MPKQPFPIHLTVDEIAYLLATLQARGIPGLDLPGLLPEDAQAREKQLLRGYQALVEHGWIEEIRQGDRIFIDLNSYLLEYIAALASPVAVIRVMQAFGDKESAQGFILALGQENLVIAWPTNQGMNFSAYSRAKLSAVLEDIGRSLGIPEQIPAILKASFTSQEIDQLKQKGTAQTSLGVAAQRLADTLTQLQSEVAITITPVRDDKLDEEQEDRFGMIIGGDKHVWAWLFDARPQDAQSEVLHFRTCDIPCFREEIENRIQRVMQRMIVNPYPTQ